MAGYNEADCSWFTLQCARVMHEEVNRNLEFVFVDNNPNGPHGEYIRNLVENHIKNGRYIPMAGTSGTAAPRDRVFREAKTDAVLCIDPHVLLPKGAVKKLLFYYDDHPDCDDLLQGPMLDDDLWGPNDGRFESVNQPKIHATHMRPVWRSEMFGIWSRLWFCNNCGQALDLREYREPAQVDEFAGHLARLRGHGTPIGRPVEPVALKATAQRGTLRAFALFADGIFHKGSAGLGFMVGCIGVGALAGVLELARHKGIAQIPGVMQWSTVGMAIAMAAFAWSPR